MPNPNPNPKAKARPKPNPNPNPKAEAMASERSTPLACETRAMSSQPQKSPGKKHSSGNVPSRLVDSGTIAEARTSSKQEGRLDPQNSSAETKAHLDESQVQRIPLRNLTLVTAYENIEPTGVGVGGKYTKGFVYGTPAMPSKLKESSGRKHTADGLLCGLKGSRAIKEDSASSKEEGRLHRQNSSSETKAHLDKCEEQLHSDLERRLEDLPVRKHHAIYPLPSSCSKEPYFTPRAVSIGPYNHGRPHLAEMECHKRRFLQDFLLRNPGKSFEQYWVELKRIEPQVRKYYSSGLDLTSASLVEMMLLDGCFILEFLIKFYYGTPDEVLDDRSLSQHIKTDLLMLANQIPFVVLLELHGVADTGSLPSVHRLLVNHFWDTSNGWPTLRSCGSHNLLHFYELQFIPPLVTEHLTARRSKEKYRADFPEKFVSQVPTAEQLKKAGVIFRGKRTINFLDIEFKDGVLEIPTISVDEPFLTLLVNLAMFEKLNIAVGKVVQTYCCLMHCLLKNPCDVQLLRIGGVIEGRSISDELLHQLGRFQNPDYLNSDKHYFADLFVDLWEYCERGEENVNAPEKRVKFSSFFAQVLAGVAAALLVHIGIQYCL